MDSRSNWPEVQDWNIPFRFWHLRTLPHDRAATCSRTHIVGEGTSPLGPRLGLGRRTPTYTQYVYWEDLRARTPDASIFSSSRLRAHAQRLPIVDSRSPYA